jgi:hypothetical protein
MGYTSMEPGSAKRYQVPVVSHLASYRYRSLIVIRPSNIHGSSPSGR